MENKEAYSDLFSSFVSALEDGKITPSEALTLAKKILDIVLSKMNPTPNETNQS